MKRGLFPAVIAGLLALGSGLAPAAAVRRADVVVYGGTAGGAAAAVAAAREGKTVLLLEPGKHVGGMVSGGAAVLRGARQPRRQHAGRGPRAGR